MKKSSRAEVIARQLDKRSTNRRKHRLETYEKQKALFDELLLAMRLYKVLVVMKSYSHNFKVGGIIGKHTNKYKGEAIMIHRPTA